MIGSDFLLIVFIYCVINKKKTNRVGSYIDYPDAIKNKKTIINPINKKDHGDFHSLYCLHSFATENKRESQENVCENKDKCCNDF